MPACDGGRITDQGILNNTVFISSESQFLTRLIVSHGDSPCVKEVGVGQIAKDDLIAGAVDTRKRLVTVIVNQVGQ